MKINTVINKRWKNLDKIYWIDLKKLNNNSINFTINKTNWVNYKNDK